MHSSLLVTILLQPGTVLRELARGDAALAASVRAWLPLLLVLPPVCAAVVVVWLVVALTAIGAIVLGGLVISRGDGRRTGAGIGIIVTGIFLGLVESLASVWIGGQYREVAALVLFLIILSFRPHGFFGRAISGVSDVDGDGRLELIGGGLSGGLVFSSTSRTPVR